MINFLLLAPIFIPLAGSVINFIVGWKNKKAVSIVNAVISGITLSVVITIYSLFINGWNLRLGFNTGLPFQLALRADGLGMILALVASTLGFMVSVYCIEYIQNNRGLFSTFMQLGLYGMLGVVFAENLFTLLLFFEIFSIASAILVIHKLTPEAIKAGFQYLLISIVGTACLIVGTAMLYIYTGSLDLTGNGIANITNGPNILIFWLLLVGFCIKAGMFPAHIWLPKSYPVAPSAAAAILSGAMAKAGAYGIIRVLYGVYGSKIAIGAYTSSILIVLAVITMIIGSLAAITQKDFKRMLAYSSVAQIGYVILGAALLNKAALTGAILHIFNHALMKGSLFLAAGALIHKTGKRNLSDYKGIGRKMPLTMTIITLSGISMIGIPPFMGFFSKWLLANGALDAVTSGVIAPWAAYTIIGALVLSGLLNAIYYGPIIINGWFGGEKPKAAHDHDEGHHEEEAVEKPKLLEPSWVMVSPAFILAGSTLIFGILVKYPLQLVNLAVKIFFRS